MPSISEISTLSTGVSGALSSIPALGNLLIATPSNTVGYQPIINSVISESGFLGTSNLRNPPALVFHYEGEQSVILESDVTDHYVESNSSVQDQVALKPELITTHGFVGDLNDVAPNSVLAALQIASKKLTSVSGYLPEISETAILAYDEAVFAYNTVVTVANSAVAAFSTIGSLIGIGNTGESVINGSSITLSQNQTPQQIYFQQFYAYWRKRTFFTIQTPWAVFQNCIIKSLRAIQDEQTRTITDFEVTFKIIRTASTTISVQSTVLGDLQGRSQNQSDFLVDRGVQTPALFSQSQSDAVNSATNDTGTPV